MAGLNVAQIKGRARDVVGRDISEGEADRILGEAWNQSIFGADPGRVDDILRSRFGQRDSGGGGGGGDGGRAAREAAERAEREAREREARMQNMLTGFQQEERDLFGRFKTAFEGQETLSAISRRLGEELGLPSLRQATSNRISAVEDVPQSVRELGAQFAISAPRQQQRIAKMLGELAPQATKAQRLQTEQEQILSSRLGLEAADRERALLPFEKEFEMLSDRIAREMSGFNVASQNVLNTLLARLSTEGTLAAQELKAANDLALLEEQYLLEKENQRQVITADGRVLIVNPITGETIADVGASSTGSGSGFSLTDYFQTDKPSANTEGQKPGDYLELGDGSSIYLTDESLQNVDLSSLSEQFGLGN